MRPTHYLIAAAIAVSAGPACDVCKSEQIIRTLFASKAELGPQIAACTADATACIPLCADILRIDRRDIQRCEITSAVYEAEVPRSKTLPQMRGVNVRVDYFSFEMCAFADGTGGFDDGGFCADGFCDGGGIDDGGIDDGGDPGDDGGDGGDGGGDEGGDGGDGGDGGGDGGGGGDGVSHLPPKR